ncbi:hypothetical protein [Alkalicoccus luteus]|uniref:Uncharacterized protein n=1 Tax=Alkalicoccus luteus TaxID=1237094 RepID=A0A969PPI4_9BACI|nr:hypothetical protein [Alkalicoccus luteus]NJP38006.1 hypothetical protein [Alkalicoccus luteus]
MDLFVFVPVGFFFIGLLIIFTVKQRMGLSWKAMSAEGSEAESPERTRKIIAFIAATTVWGVISIFLVVWFFNRFGA